MLRLVVVVGVLLATLCEGRTQESGVRHRIDVIVGVGPNSTLLRDTRSLVGSVGLSVSVSANSKESLFYSVLTPTFREIVVPAMPAVLINQTKIWEEDRCHQKRGMPKVTVLLLKGAFKAGDEHYDVSSVIRHIGIRVPADELMPGIKLPAGGDQIGRFYAVRAQSKDTKLDVDLKIYAYDCNIADVGK